MMQDNYTMFTIEAEKARVKVEMNKLKAQMQKRTESLFAPPPADTKVQRIVNTAERAVAVWDGLWMGYKLMKVFGFLLPGRRRKRR